MSFVRKVTSGCNHEHSHSVSTYGALPSSILRPGVNFKVEGGAEPNDILMEPATTLALACLDDSQFSKHGRWSLSPSERELLLGKMDSSKKAGGDGTLSKSDFKDFCSKDENKQWVLQVLPSSAHGLACHSLTKNAFSHFDKNHDKVLDQAEFNLFMDFLSQVRLRYLQQMSFVAFRCYFGRGHPHTDTSHLKDGHSITTRVERELRKQIDEIQDATRARIAKGEKLEKTIQIGNLVSDWKAWKADLYYYSANVHPLHGIWACSSNNRLDRSDRLMMEFATLCFCLWMAHERLILLADPSGQSDLMIDIASVPRYWSITFVTVPSIVVYFILYFLFTTPKCGTVDESRATPAAFKRAAMVSRIGDALGNIFVFALIGVMLWRVISEWDVFDVSSIPVTLFGRVGSYAGSWAMMVGIYFNPFMAWGSAKPGTTCLGDLIGLGQWNMEQRKVWLTTLELPENRVDLAADILESMKDGANLGPDQVLNPEEVIFMEQVGEQLAENAPAEDSKAAAAPAGPVEEAAEVAAKTNTDKADAKPIMPEGYDGSEELTVLDEIPPHAGAERYEGERTNGETCGSRWCCA